MKKIFIGSVKERSGKSMLALGLGLNFSGSVSYFKPFRESVAVSNGELIDYDTRMMKEALRLNTNENKMSPFPIHLIGSVSLNDVRSAFDSLGEHDLAVIEGSRTFMDGFSSGLSGFDISKALGADVVLVSPSDSRSADFLSLLNRAASLWGVKIKGVVLFGEGDISKMLEKNGLDVLGRVPKQESLGEMTMHETAKELNGTVLTPVKKETVNGYSLGVTNAESVSKSVRANPDRAVIINGNRSELLLSAAYAGAGCIIAAGGITPSPSLLSAAERSNCTVILTDLDPVTACEKMERRSLTSVSGNTAKLESIKKIIGENADLSKIFG
ncbi:MAG: AAA family ATPase [Candidatus Methanoplasma sp.]|jgi:BioD-like phosphotransacetylase family protein|nr:AAA family ATPase [Candidatus Methanoplasma sp.]